MIGQVTSYTYLGERLFISVAAASTQPAEVQIFSSVVVGLSPEGWIAITTMNAVTRANRAATRISLRIRATLENLSDGSFSGASDVPVI